METGQFFSSTNSFLVIRSFQKKKITNNNKMVYNISSRTACNKARNYFADQNSGFHRCVVQNSFPNLFCSNCIELYVAQLQAYNILLVTRDTQDMHKACGDRFIEKDRINMIEHSYRSAKDLWNIGFCTRTVFQLIIFFFCGVTIDLLLMCIYRMF